MISLPLGLAGSSPSPLPPHIALKLTNNLATAKYPDKKPPSIPVAYHSTNKRKNVRYPNRIREAFSSFECPYLPSIYNK
jgi:hypothetical protein